MGKESSKQQLAALLSLRGAYRTGLRHCGEIILIPLGLSRWSGCLAVWLSVREAAALFTGFPSPEKAV